MKTNAKMLLSVPKAFDNLLIESGEGEASLHPSARRINEKQSRELRTNAPLSAELFTGLRASSLCFQG